MFVLSGAAAPGAEPAVVPDLVVVRAGQTPLPGDGIWLRRASGTWAPVVDADGGTIADPAVDPTGRLVAFAWRRRGADGFRLAQVDLMTAQTSAITRADATIGDDRAPAWLADGTLVFRSTRMGQAAPGGSLAGALFLIAPDGKFMRRVTWDQDIVGAPHVLDDGRILYLRTDGVGRPTYPVAMTMHADGTNQKPWYSWQDARPPQPDLLVGIDAAADLLWAGNTRPLHGPSADEDGGDAVLRAVWTINRLAGRQFPTGMTPLPRGGKEDDIRDARRIGPSGWIAVSGSGAAQALVLGPALGAWQTQIALPEAGGGDQVRWHQPQAVQPRTWYGSFPSVVDHRQPTGFLYIQDIGIGDGLPEAVRRQVTQVRLIALHWPLAGAGQSSPLATIVGTVPLEADGSLFVQVPAATPLMVQALDARGATVGRMRSWLALQPGERLSCVGCHSDERQAPPMGKPVAAFLREPRTPVVPSRPSLAFATAIAPLLVQSCGSCHGAPGAGNAPLPTGASPPDMYAWLVATGWLRETPERRSPFAQVIAAAESLRHPPVQLAPDARELLAAWYDSGSLPPQPEVPTEVLTRAAAWAREEGLAIRAFNLHRFGQIEQ